MTEPSNEELADSLRQDAGWIRGRMQCDGKDARSMTVGFVTLGAMMERMDRAATRLREADRHREALDEIASAPCVGFCRWCHVTKNSVRVHLLSCPVNIAHKALENE